MFEMFLKGGFAMYPLLALSVLTLAIGIERLVYLRRVRVDAGEFMAKVKECFSRNALEEAEKYAGATDSPVSRIVTAGLKNHRRSRMEILRAIEDQGALEVARLEKGILTLQTVSKMAPLLGLFGTVTGMIRSFQAMGGGANDDPRAVANGISEALIATAAGLIVAIPAYFLAAYFMSRVSKFMLDMQTSSIELLDAMAELEERIAERSERLDTIGGDYLEV